MKNHFFLTLFLCLALNSFSQNSPSVSDIFAGYKSRLIQNGGSISNGDSIAIYSFIVASKNHQYWDKLIDVGPLAGNNINSAMVKLKFYNTSFPLIGNAGFQSADYVPDQGLQLNPLKSLYSNANLSTMSLQGLYGLSMWLDNGGTSCMGSPNNNTPFSMIFARSNRVETYIGMPPNYVGMVNDINTAPTAFYHVIKQSLNSTKVFVNNKQVGNTNNILTTTQLRDANVEVFRDAGTTGKGMFYCIDNGRLTDEEVSFFYEDVRQLMFGLGRKLAPPVISADGLYNNTQQVSITSAPTSSNLSGAIIYYTTDGSTPTIASLVYTAPFTVSVTTRIQAIAVKNGKVSDLVSSWVAIVPAGFNTTKYYTAHVMVNLLSFTNNMVEWVSTMKASGYNLIWAHLDDYSGSYIPTLKRLMDAADSVGGIKVMPGASWWVDPNRVSQMYQDTWNHPALFKIGGKKIYTSWDYKPDNQSVLDNLLTQNNMPRDQYYLWPSSRYPFSYDNGNTFVGEHLSPAGFLDWYGISSAGQVTDIDHLYQTRPQLDGLINFAVDQGNKQNTIRTNRLIAQSSIQRGKFSMGGVSAFYASVSYTDFGFKGAAEVWDSIIALPFTGRPTAMSDITANDYAELSYMAPTVIPPTNGLSYIPPFSSGFTIGDNIRYPLTDHSGIQKFLRPWVDAFLNNQAAPVFTEDRMFAWYWLHPKDQAPTTTVPALFSGYPQLSQQWWNSTLYATGNINIGGTDQVQGMKTYIGAGMEKIRLAAHLTAPARLKINDSISEIMPAGAAFYEIEMGSFRGTPTFSIIRSGAEVKKGTGLQPITNNVFPGGWNFLATEITGTVTNTGVGAKYYRSKSTGNWNSLSTWQSSVDSIGWSDATAIPSSSVSTITIQNGHTINIIDTLTVDQLVIKSGGVLNVLPNASIIVNDGAGNDIAIETAGKMIIQSNASGTGRIGNSSGNIAGNVTVERYISAANNKSYRLLAPSVNTANGIKPFIRDNWQEGQNNTGSVNNNAVANYGIHITGSVTGANGFDATATASPSLLVNNGTGTSSWVAIPNTNATNLDAKKGYLVFIRGDRSTDLAGNLTSSNTTLRATGSIVAGTQNFTNQAGNGQTSLVTNPYACPINWSLIYNDLSLANRSNFEDFYNYWDPNVGTAGGYVTVNVNGTRSAVTNATVEIQSGQAFFIKAKAGVVLPTFTIKESHKSTNNSRDVFRTTGLKQQFFATLYFSADDGRRIMADAVNAIFDTSFSAKIDRNDAEEMANEDENIAINRAGKMFSIEARPLVNTTDTLPLAIQRLKIRNYEWQFDPADFTPPNLQAYLEDSYLNLRSPINLTNVTVIPFSVSANPASAAQNRFRIVFAPSVVQPVIIHSLKAHQKGSGIEVDWVTEYDSNVDRYEIEKSDNNRQFTKAGIVLAYANKLLTNTYTWLDNIPNEGYNYYRIKEVDKTGGVQYSEVVNVKTSDKKESFEVYPNPLTGDHLTVRLNNIVSGKYTVNLLNANGQRMFSKIINHEGGSASETITCNSGFPAGYYNVQITGNGKSFIKRVVK